MKTSCRVARVPQTHSIKDIFHSLNNIKGIRVQVRAEFFGEDWAKEHADQDVMTWRE